MSVSKTNILLFFIFLFGLADLMFAASPDLSAWISGSSENPLPGLTAQLAPFVTPATAINSASSRRLSIGAAWNASLDIQCPQVFSALAISSNLTLGLNCGAGKWREDNIFIFGPLITSSFGKEDSPWIAAFTFTNLVGMDDFHIISDMIGLSRFFTWREWQVNAGLSRVHFKWRVHAEDLSDASLDGSFSAQSAKLRLNLSVYRRVNESIKWGLETGFTDEIPTLSLVILGDI